MLVGVGLVTSLVVRVVGSWEGGGAAVSGAARGGAWLGCGGGGSGEGAEAGCDGGTTRMEGMGEGTEVVGVGLGQNRGFE